MNEKAYVPFEVKEIDEEARAFTGLASTWDLDLDGDVIQQGAYAKTLDDWRGSNGRRIIPLLDQHNYHSVRSVIGKTEELEETDAGLEGTWSIVESSDGDEYMARIKGGYLNGLSIGYQATRADTEEREVGSETVSVRVIKEIKLREISAVIWGANPNALIDTAAARALVAEAKARDLTEHEIATLKSLHEEIGALLEGPEPDGIAPDDPKRIEIEARLRGLRLTGIRAG